MDTVNAKHEKATKNLYAMTVTDKLWTYLVADSPARSVCLVYLSTARATDIACLTRLRSDTAPTSCDGL